MPRWTLDIDDFVYALGRTGSDSSTHDGTLNLEYYERLIATADQFGPEVALAIVDRLRRLTDADAVLDVVEKSPLAVQRAAAGASMTSDDRGLPSPPATRCPHASRDADPGRSRARRRPVGVRVHRTRRPRASNRRIRRLQRDVVGGGKRSSLG